MVRFRHLSFLLYPPAPVAATAAQLLRAPFLDGAGGRSAPMSEDRLHVTLHQVGRFADGVPPEELDRALAVGAAMTDEPFDVVFDRLRSGTRTGPLVVDGSGPAVRKLRDFQRYLRDTMRRMGFAADKIRPSFSPHMTLDYAHQPVAEQSITPIAWRVTQFLLVASHYGEGRHEVLERWPLTARQLELFSDG